MPLTGAANVRDIGGYPAAGGREVAWGKVLRGDALCSLTEADSAVLAGLGLHTVIDFRTPGEILLAGEDKLPAGVTLVSLPVRGGDMGTFYEVITGGDAQLQERLLGGGQAARYMAEACRAFVADPRQRQCFAAALRYIAVGLPLLYHCTAGKDRTGWMTAIVLTALGVERADVMDDYLLSNEYLRASHEKLLSDLAATGMMRDPELLRPILEQRPAYLEAAFGEAGRQFGSFGAFLATGLGADGPMLQALRDTLLS